MVAETMANPLADPLDPLGPDQRTLLRLTGGHWVPISRTYVRNARAAFARLRGRGNTAGRRPSAHA